MDILQLHNELISHILLCLSPNDIYNLICAHSKFNNVFNWNLYFKYHLDININLSKKDLLIYNEYFVSCLNDYYFYNYVVNNHNESLESDIEYYQYGENRSRSELKEKLLFINRVVGEYKDNELYQKLIKKNKPVFLRRNDLIDKYIGWTAVNTQRILDLNIQKVIIIDEQLNLNINDAFGHEAVYIIKSYLSNSHSDYIIISKMNEF